MVWDTVNIVKILLEIAPYFDFTYKEFCILKCTLENIDQV